MFKKKKILIKSSLANTEAVQEKLTGDLQVKKVEKHCSRPNGAIQAGPAFRMQLLIPNLS